YATNVVPGSSPPQFYNEIAWGAPSSWGAAIRRDVHYAVASQWEAIYNGGDTTIKQYEDAWGDSPATPVLRNWFPQYARFELGRHNANALLIECGEQWRGSSMQTFTRQAMRYYCGLIT